MAFQILSDLHLESPKGYDLYEIVPTAPYLALLGDIGNVVRHSDDFFEFLKTQLRQFRIVFFVPGNHEAYHSSWVETINSLEAFRKATEQDETLGEFVLLNRQSFQLPNSNTVILGCSLFSHVPRERYIAVEMGLNDFYQIQEWDVITHNEAHQRDLNWLNTRVAELESQGDISIIVLTHWSPSTDTRANNPRHAGSAINSAFVTDLSQETCFKSNKVKVWAFGHTHYNCDFEVERGQGIGVLRLLTNQRGYYFAQADGFDQGKRIEG